MAIHSLFHSFHNKAPFSECIQCGRYLLTDDCVYMIEKAMRRYPGFEATDVVFDFAICMDCAQELNEELSVESRAKISKYIQSHLKPERLASRLNESPETFINECMIHGNPVEDEREYQLYATCRGNNLVTNQPPFMIGGKALEELQELISEKTRDIMNGFFERHFQPDPTLLEPVPGPGILLV